MMNIIKKNCITVKSRNMSLHETILNMKLQMGILQNVHTLSKISNYTG